MGACVCSLCGAAWFFTSTSPNLQELCEHQPCPPVCWWDCFGATWKMNISILCSEPAVMNGSAEWHCFMKSIKEHYLMKILDFLPSFLCHHLQSETLRHDDFLKHIKEAGVVQEIGCFGPRPVLCPLLHAAIPALCFLFSFPHCTSWLQVGPETKQNPAIG